MTFETYAEDRIAMIRAVLPADHPAKIDPAHREGLTAARMDRAAQTTPAVTTARATDPESAE